jgi:pimeloyl-ACP methyl ester carboxylesterase
MSYVKTRDDVRLYVKDWGQGRPVVLLHGWPLSADAFDDLSMAIADAGHRAIAYDRRGFGRSDQPFSGYDYDTLADDLADVMEQTGARDATILGFSMGGGEVARYCGQYGTEHVRAASGQECPASNFDLLGRPLLAEDRQQPGGRGSVHFR